MHVPLAQPFLPCCDYILYPIIIEVGIPLLSSFQDWTIQHLGMLGSCSVRSKVLIPAFTVPTPSLLWQRSPVSLFQDANNVLGTEQILPHRTRHRKLLLSWSSLTCGWRCWRSLLGLGGSSIRSHQGTTADSRQGFSQECARCVQEQSD